MRQDRQWRASLALFLLCAWPTWVVRVPPLQDLPNHLATAFVQSHLESHHELVSNGFLKTNSTLFLFLHVVSQYVPLRVAAQLFVTLTCAVGALAYPEAVKRLGNKNVYSASFFLWPFVHNWFVAMGMLDYALSVPLVLLVLAIIRERPLVAAILAVLVWYTHAFGVVMLGLLVTLEIVSTRKWKDAPRMYASLLASFALLASSILVQLGSETTAGSARMFQSAPALLYGAWAEWMWSMSKWTIASIACALVLAWYGARHFRERPAFFSPLAMGVLVALYIGLPYQSHRWYYVTSRILPFVWMGCALRVPAEIPKWMRHALSLCALSFSVGLGVEYVQNANVWSGFSRGEVAVPTGSRLLPMMFDRKGPRGDNTWPMLHAWGLYVIDRDTSAPLVFAHSKSFPLSYAVEPPARFHGITLEQFPQTMKTRDAFCAETKPSGDCARAYDVAWGEFWDDATPRFDRVVMYGAGSEVRERIPKTFRFLYDENETLVLATTSSR